MPEQEIDLLRIITTLEIHEDEFTIQEIVAASHASGKGKQFSASHVNQMLVALAAAGLVYKNRHGKYSFAVPQFGRFVLRH